MVHISFHSKFRFQTPSCSILVNQKLIYEYQTLKQLSINPTHYLLCLKSKYYFAKINTPNIEVSASAKAIYDREL